MTAVSRTTRIWLVVAAALVLSGLIHLGVFVLDDRPWGGPLSWRKPTTFGLSFGLTLGSVVWVTSMLAMSPRRRQWLLGVFTADCVLEVAGITLQAWRGVPSHLNTSTPFDAAVAALLGFGGLVLVVVLGAFAVLALRGRVAGAASTVLAVRGGFALLVAGLLAGVAMIARGSIVRQTVSQDAAYGATGFLKDFHGVTLHAVLVLPAVDHVLGWAGTSERARLVVVRGLLTLYVTAAAVVLVADLLRA